MSIFTDAQAALFTPGNRPDRLRKALSGSADIVIADLEDAVGRDDKDSARAAVSEVLRDCSYPVTVRINPVTTEIGQNDIRMISKVLQNKYRTGGNLAVMFPKFEPSESLDRSLGELPSTVPVVGLIETTVGVFTAEELAKLPQVVRLSVGAVDLASEIGCEAGGSPIDFARAAIVLASVGANIAAPLDTPCLSLSDQDTIRRHGQRAVKDGFGGSLCIHPRQIEGIKGAFRPTEAQVEWARKVLAAEDGASAIDGEMVDAPVMARAKTLLERASERR